MGISSPQAIHPIGLVLLIVCSTPRVAAVAIDSHLGTRQVAADSPAIDSEGATSGGAAEWAQANAGSLAVIGCESLHLQTPVHIPSHVPTYRIEHYALMYRDPIHQIDSCK
jgi:hypothetical protein